MLAARAELAAPCWQGRIPRIADGTSLTQRGGTGTDWRLHGVFDLGRGGFCSLQLTDGRGAESLTRGRPVGGEIRVADRGFSRAAAMAAYLAAGRGRADFIVRLRRQIELAFKRLKSLLRIDRLPTVTPAASRSWLQAHLVMALPREEASQDFLDSFP